MEPPYAAAARPTLHFIGVSTAGSSIMRVFPAWAEHLGLSGAIHGIDFPPHDRPERYRECVSFIKEDPLSLGALVTTHKLDLLQASRDLFDELDPYARRLDEVSCISKRDGRLRGHAKDPISCGLALEAFVRPGYWAQTGAEMLVLGAGGASLALTAYLLERARSGQDVPSRVVVTNRSPGRLEQMRRVHGDQPAALAIEYRHCPQPEDNDRELAGLKPGSLVINATGLGKDAPGSPLTDQADFPEGGLVWDFNYRGDLAFLAQAEARRRARGLTIEDGWVYFLHGWLQVIGEVFQLDLPVRGPGFEKLGEIAASFRSRA